MIAILQSCNFGYQKLTIGDQNLGYKELLATKSDIQSKALPAGRESRIPAENHEMLFEKYAFQKNSCTQKQILCQNAILFLDGEIFIKRGNSCKKVKEEQLIMLFTIIFVTKILREISEQLYLTD